MATKGLNTTKGSLDWDHLMTIARAEMKEGDKDLGLYIAISLYTGLRANEIQKLKLEKCFVNKQVVDHLTIFQSKNRKFRKIKVSSGLKEVLEGCGRRSGYIIRGRRNKPMTIQRLNIKIKEIGVRHGVGSASEISTHALRKTFARRVYDRNKGREEATLVLLSEIFGHSSTAITRRYLGLTQDELDGAYNNLG